MFRFAFVFAAITMVAGLSPVRAQSGSTPGEVEAMAKMFRDVWADPKASEVKSVSIPTTLFGRLVNLKIPRGFVPGSIQRSADMYLAEYVPDGQTVHDWKQMITVVAMNDVGALPVTMEQIGSKFDPSARCSPSVFKDLGDRPDFGDAKVRLVTMGCGRSPTAAGEVGEQAFIYVLRDDKNIYTVQYAYRGKPYTDKAPIPFEEAEARLAVLGPILVCNNTENTACK
ncbi:hypothetical protein [Sandaracinobacteroides hominis]|uniref:hypothetical protein n=1 Tax=Sandaracinobacteroides hominis TaxID=2780086 RepID=UPI0018F3331A|nr:hypothetical protein [Sandaracinobacteroides hominis]